jgi:hypothetical protein
VQRDSIWLMVFMNLFRVLLETDPGAMSIEFVFDENKNIAEHARTLHKRPSMRPLSMSRENSLRASRL